MSYSFRRLVREGKIDFLDIPAKAKEIGLDVIEYSTVSLPEGENALTFAPKVKEASDKAGIPIANYTIGADFLKGSDGDLNAEIERVRDEVRVAKILGVPGMRHDATGGFLADNQGPRSFDDALPRLVEGCRAVTAFAAENKIKTMVENHGHFCQDSRRVEKLVSAVAHENFGVLIDMGNFVCVDEDPGIAVGRLIPYATHCNAKDFHIKSGKVIDPGEGWARTRGGNFRRGAIIGHGDVPVVQCISVMKSGGYDGVLSIEFEGLEEPLFGIATGLANLRRFVEMVG